MNHLQDEIKSSIEPPSQVATAGLPLPEVAATLVRMGYAMGSSVRTALDVDEGLAILGYRTVRTTR